MIELNQAEQKVFDFVNFYGGSIGIDPITVAYALPSLDVYAIIQRLVDRGILERVGGAVRLATSPAVPGECRGWDIADIVKLIEQAEAA